MWCTWQSWSYANDWRKQETTSMAKRCQVKLVEAKASTTTEEKRSEGNEALHKVGGRYTFIDKSVTEPTGQRKQSRGSGRYGKWYTMERKLRASITGWITGRKKTAVECSWSSVSSTSLTQAVRAFNVKGLPVKGLSERAQKQQDTRENNRMSGNADNVK